MLNRRICQRLAPLLLTLALQLWLAPRSGFAAPRMADLTLGRSGDGRPITALKIGDGPRKFALVGDTHGGPEANTFQLATMLADYFRAHPAEVPASVRLYIIPTLNPDGLAGGTRFNGRGVDLNRNMNTNTDTCPENDWNIHVQGAYGVESDTGGPYAESEPESRLIRDFLLDASGVIFYHSLGGDVFPAFREHAGADHRHRAGLRAEPGRRAKRAAAGRPTATAPQGSPGTGRGRSSADLALLESAWRGGTLWRAAGAGRASRRNHAAVLRARGDRAAPRPGRYTSSRAANAAGAHGGAGARFSAGHRAARRAFLR